MSNAKLNNQKWSSDELLEEIQWNQVETSNPLNVLVLNITKFNMMYINNVRPKENTLQVINYEYCRDTKRH